MPKVNNLNELRNMRNQLIKKVGANSKDKKSGRQVRIKVAMATCSIASGSTDTLNFIIDELEKRNIDAQVSQTGCMSYCYAEPTIEVTMPGLEPVIFGQVDEKKADEIIERYIKNGELVDGIIPKNYDSIA
jgi:NADP-reducing hydrogenase subunit HndB